jgi:mono/diheme cytochrome c family protein
VSRRLARALAAAAALSAASAQATPPPAQDYVLECRGCHGARGEGAGAVPSLAQSARFLSTPRGRAYLVRVPGVAGSQLSDARIAALLNFVLRELASDPPATEGFAPFSEAEVARERSRRLLQPSVERAAILAASD